MHLVRIWLQGIVCYVYARSNNDADLSCLSTVSSCSVNNDDRDGCLMSKEESKALGGCAWCEFGCFIGLSGTGHFTGDEKCLSEFEVLNMYDSINPANIAENSDSAFARDSCSGENQSCKSHSDCSEYADAPFCYAGECASCDECEYCHDGIDGTCGFCGEGYPTRESKTCTLEGTEQEQFPGNDLFMSSTEEPFPDFFMSSTEEPFLMSSTEMSEEDCDKLPVYLYWSELYKNSVYIPHNQSPPSSYKSYVLIDKMFSFYWQDCEKKGNVVLFQCRTEENDDYADSILSESPDFECTARTGYTFKEPIGRCFANKNDAEGLVALQK